MNIQEISSARKRNGSISGLFWTMPEQWQRERILALSRQFNRETVATITGRSVRDVSAICEAAR